MKLQLPDQLPSVVVEVDGRGLHPGLVRVPGVIHVAAVHLGIFNPK